MRMVHRAMVSAAFVAGISWSFSGSTGCGFESTLSENFDSEVQSFARRLAESICAQAFACKCDPAHSKYGGFTSQENCIEALEIRLRADVVPLQEAFRGDRITYDSFAAENCLAAVAGLSCADTFEDLFPRALSEKGFGACWNVFQGQADVEKPCHLDVDCLGDLACIQSDQPICQVLPGENESCSKDGRCRQGLACVEQICIARVDNGGSCTNNDQCKTRVCQFVEYQCKTPGPLGSLCDDNSECIIGVCDVGYCNAFALGEQCAMDGECESGACDVMICAVPRANGQSCRLDRGCASGYCQGSSATCQPVRMIGGVCTESAGCAGGWCKNGTCVAFMKDGAACLVDESCTSGACILGICQAKREPGQVCETSTHCLNGYCDNGTCAAKFPDGAPCPINDHSLCLNGACGWQYANSGVCVAGCTP